MALGAKDVGAYGRPGLRDLQRLGDRAAGQSLRRRGEQHQAGGLARPQARQRIVLDGSQRQHRGVVVDAVGVRVVRQYTAGEVARGDARDPVRSRHAASRNPGRRGVTSAPDRQLGEVLPIRAVPERGLGDQRAQRGQILQPAQEHPGASRPRAHQRDVAARNRPRAVMAAVGAPARNGGSQRDVQIRRRIGVGLDDSQMVRVGRFWQPVHAALPVEGGQRHHAVIQCRTATEYQVAGVGVGVRQQQIGVGIQVEALALHPPLPGLRIVHRRRPAGEGQRGPQSRGVGKGATHRLITCPE